MSKNSTLLYSPLRYGLLRYGLQFYTTLHTHSTGESRGGQIIKGGKFLPFVDYLQYSIIRDCTTVLYKCTWKKHQIGVLEGGVPGVVIHTSLTHSLTRYRCLYSKHHLGVWHGGKHLALDNS